MLGPTLTAVSGTSGTQVTTAAVRTTTANTNTSGTTAGQATFQDTLTRERSAEMSSSGTVVLDAANVNASGAELPSVTVDAPSGYTLLPAGGATSALTGISPGFGTPAWQSPTVGTSANPPDLRGPSTDTNGLLNQYLYVYNNWGKGTLPADTSPLFSNLANVKSQIVQLMGSTLMSGPSYTGGMGYAVSSADVATSQKLAAETNGEWNYNPDLLGALGRGLAGYAVNGPILGATTGSYGASYGITGGAPGAAISTDVTGMRAAEINLTADADTAATRLSAARTGAPAAAGTTAGRIAALQYTIAHDTQRYRTQRAAGNKITAAVDLASVAAARKSLARLTGT